MTIEQDKKKKSQETNIAPQILNFPKLFSGESPSTIADPNLSSAHQTPTPAPLGLRKF